MSTYPIEDLPQGHLALILCRKELGADLFLPLHTCAATSVKTPSQVKYGARTRFGNIVMNYVL